MNCIVCATRGGEGSRAVQSEAIRIAKESGNPLVFLYVLDISNLGQMDPFLLQAVRDELTWLGKALVNAARQRAWAEDITAQVIIREGNVEDEICRYLMETHASQLLLGAPRGTTPFFGDDAVEQFAAAITRDTGIPVKVIRPESVNIKQYHETIAPPDSGQIVHLPAAASSQETTSKPLPTQHQTSEE